MNYDVVRIIVFYFVYSMLSATLAGTLCYGIWLLLSRGAAKFAVNHGMACIKAVMGCYVVPAVVCFGVLRSLGKLEGEGVVSTAPMIVVYVIAGIACVIAIVISIMRRIGNYWKRRLLCVYNKPVEDIHTREVMHKWKERLGITENVAIFYNELIDSPCIMYARGYQILLPSQYPMEEEEMDSALLHELMHLKRGDIRAKNMAFVVNILHCLNPFTYLLRKELIRWMEIACDVDCFEQLDEENGRRWYYRSIMNLKEKSEAVIGSTDTMCCLFEDQSLLKFRINTIYKCKSEKMQGYRRKGLMGIAILSALVMMVSIGTVYVSVIRLSDAASVYVETETPDGEYQTVSMEKLLKDAIMTYHEENIVDRNESIDLELDPGEAAVYALTESLPETVNIIIACNAEKYLFGFVEENGEVEYREETMGINEKLCLEDRNSRQFFIMNLGEKKLYMELFLSTLEFADR